MSDEAVQLGQKIRIIREALGTTQEKLAENAEISLKHLGEIERGRGNPTLSTMVALSKALNVSLSDLTDLGDKDHSPDTVSLEIRALVERQDRQTRDQALRVLKALLDQG